MTRSSAKRIFEDLLYSSDCQTNSPASRPFFRVVVLVSHFPSTASTTDFLPIDAFLQVVEGIRLPPRNAMQVRVV